MDVFIRDIAIALPEKTVTNEDLKRENPDWDMEWVESRTGVTKRQIAGPDETALDLAVTATKILLKAHPELQVAVDAIIFCTETPDHVIPPNSSILHGNLGFGENVFALDINLGCSGYPYSLALAHSLLISKIATNILLINADTYSKLIDPRDQSVRVLFGDGAAVSWISTSGPGGRVVDIQCGTSGKYFDKFIVPAGACRNPSTESDVSASGDSRNPRTIHMDGKAILGFVNSKIPIHVRKVLADNQIELADIDLFVFHQASKLALDSLTRLLRIEPKRVFSNLSDVGNLVSASIPVALRHAMNQGRITSTNTVMLTGFGLGLSWGSVIVKWCEN